MSLISGIHPERIPDDAWEFEGLSADGLRRTYVHWIDREKGIFVRKTENLAEPQIIAENRQMYNDSFGRRFGDMPLVARIPLNEFYQQFPQRLADGDNDFVKWYLNSERAKPFRTFRGRV